MPRLQLSILGGFNAESDAGRPLVLKSRKLQGLLAYLALSAGQAHPRETLAGLLWSDVGDKQASDSLRQALVTLRSALAAIKVTALVTEGSGVRLDVDAIDVDVVTFDRLLARGTPETLEEAAALARGDLLAGVSIDEAPFEDWLRGERERLREQLLGALERLREHQATTAPESALRTALRLVALDPVLESGHRAVMQLYAAQGRRAAAIAQYQVCVAALQRELGVQPEAETRRLYQDLLRQQQAETPPAPPGRAQDELPASETRLIGREPELRLLHDAFTAARAGRGATVAVVGEAGIGKSRLVAEVAQHAQAQGAYVVVGHCYDGEQVLPLGPWKDVLGAEIVAPAAEPLRVFESAAQSIDELASRQPVVLIIEDLHWGDELSVRLLGFLTRRVTAGPVLILTTVRAEELVDVPLVDRLFSALLRESRLRVITLSSLSRDETTSFVQALTHADPDGRLDERVWALSQGQPFMALEMVRALQQGVAVSASDEGTTPERVRNLVHARLERLGEASRRVASVAAVIGRPFDFTLLQQATGLDEGATAAAVEELTRRRILGAAGDQLAFTHDRIREVAYHEVLAPMRKAIHGAVAKTIETLYADQLERYDSALATHHRESGAWARAIACFLRAGQYAQRRSAPREAARCYEEALACVEHLPASRAREEHAVDVRLMLCTAFNSFGNSDGSDKRLTEAADIASALADRTRLGRIYASMAGLGFVACRLRAGVDAGTRALAIAEEVGDVALRVWSQLNIQMISWRLGDYRRSIDMAHATLPLLQARGLTESFGSPTPTPPAVPCYALLAPALAETGAFAEGRAAADAALRLAHELDQRFSETLGLLGLGFVQLREGDPTAAAVTWERAVALAQAGEYHGLLVNLRGLLGQCYALTGRVREAIGMIEGVLAAAGPLPLAFAEVALADAYLRDGAIERAQAQAERALRLSLETAEAGAAAWARKARADVALARGDRADAERRLTDALDAATTLGMRPLEAQCRLALAALKT